MQEFRTDHPEQYKKKALQWASLFDTACYFDSNGYPDPYSAFDVLIAAGAKTQVTASAGTAFTELEEFLKRTSGYRLGFFGYDLKNETENLVSGNPDHLGFPDLFFFEPVHLIVISGNLVRITSPDASGIHGEITRGPEPLPGNTRADLRPRMSRAEYIRIVEKIRGHIGRGDAYEVTFCQEFYAEDTAADPVSVFLQLNASSPTPFSNFFRLNDKYIISATPERFLSRRGRKLISQPIKGTAPRSPHAAEDRRNRDRLLLDEKERAENVMIVDLVRNDLTRCAVPGTVTVEELFGIYSFPQVHQMISTVVCEASPALSDTEIIRNAFPMGSMTGAPKLRAMELIETYERSARGVYSGAVGYFSPWGDFDFNVIIRTVLYNASLHYLSCHVGSAITYEADPAREYDECLLKAAAIQAVLKP